MIVRSWERSEKQAGKVFLLPFSKPNTNLSGRPLGILVWICLKTKKGREPEKRYGLFVNSLALKPDKLHTKGAYPIIQWPWLTASHPWTLTPSCIKRGSRKPSVWDFSEEWKLARDAMLLHLMKNAGLLLLPGFWCRWVFSTVHLIQVLTRLYLRARHVSGQAQESP